MDIRPLTDRYAVSPQIDPQDAAAIKAAGYTTVICNRPDAEVPGMLQAAAMRTALEAEGLRFVVNPIDGRGMGIETVEAQAALLAEADGPVLAYCASGTRSAFVWAFAQAGQMPTDEIIAAGMAQGYPLAGLRGQIEALATR
jgi:uncharacterized protein (TIGR01244 family)